MRSLPRTSYREKRIDLITSSISILSKWLLLYRRDQDKIFLPGLTKVLRSLEELENRRVNLLANDKRSMNKYHAGMKTIDKNVTRQD